MKDNNKNSFVSVLDNLGIFNSSLCGVHCLITPFLALLPIGGVFIGFWHELNLVSLVITPTIAFFSLLPAHAIHGKPWPGGLFVLGYTLFALGCLGHFFSFIPYELYFTVCGGALLASAHLVNAHFLAKAQSSLASEPAGISCQVSNVRL